LNIKTTRFAIGKQIHYLFCFCQGDVGLFKLLPSPQSNSQFEPRKEQNHQYPRFIFYLGSNRKERHRNSCRNLANRWSANSGSQSAFLIRGFKSVSRVRMSLVALLFEIQTRATPGFAVEKRSSGTFRFEREKGREAKTLSRIAKAASSPPGIAYQSAVRKNSRALCRLIRTLPECDCAVGVGTYNERGIHVSDTLSCSLIWTDLGADRAVGGAREHSMHG
jgi:hypothetical protein